MAIILLQYFTHHSPDKLSKTLTDWYEKASGEHKLFWQINIQQDDKYTNEPVTLDFLEHFIKDEKNYEDSNIHILRDKLSTTESINANVSKDVWDILITPRDGWTAISDWDKIVYEDFNEQFNQSLWYGENESPEIAILGRELYDKVGYVYNPAFRESFHDYYQKWEFQQTGKLKHYYDEIFFPPENEKFRHDVQKHFMDQQTYYEFTQEHPNPITELMIMLNPHIKNRSQHLCELCGNIFYTDKTDREYDDDRRQPGFKLTCRLCQEGY